MLKKKTIEKPILSLPSLDKVFQVETDASGTIIRVVMSQEQIPVAYFSKKLNEEKKVFLISQGVICCCTSYQKM